MRTIQSVLEVLIKGGGFDRHLHRVKLLTGGNGSLTASMIVHKEDTNRGGFLHGGMSTLLVDGLSTAALMSHPDCESPGVSINLNMSFVKAVNVGKEIIIKASTDKVGKRLAFLNVEICEKETGEIIVKGSHTKFIGFKHNIAELK